MRRQRHVIARLADFPPGTRRVVPLGGPAGIGVYNVAGRFYALRNICPHEGAPLCQGPQRAYVRAERVGARYAFVYERDGEIVACPWHGLEYHVPTGRCLAFSNIKLRTYEVLVEDGQVKIRV